MKFGEMLCAQDSNSIITGQLFFRETSNDTSQRITGSLRNIFSVCGVFAIPVNYPFKGEHQYTLAGMEVKSQGGIIIALDPTTEHDISEISLGDTPNGLLKSTIWRV